LIRVRQQVEQQVGGHPLAGLDATEHEYGGIRNDLLAAQSGRCTVQPGVGSPLRSVERLAE
jgi:hypothetical protein